MGLYGFIFTTYPSQYENRRRGSGRNHPSTSGYRIPQHHSSRSHMQDKRLDTGYYRQGRAAPQEHDRRHDAHSRSRSRSRVRNPSRIRPLTPPMPGAHQLKSLTREKPFLMQANSRGRSNYPYSSDRRKENTHGRRHKPSIHDLKQRASDRATGYDPRPSSKPSKAYRTSTNGAFRAYGPEAYQTSAPFRKRYTENVSSSQVNARHYLPKQHERFAKSEGQSRNYTDESRDYKRTTWVRPPNARPEDAVMYAPQGRMRLRDEKNRKLQKRVRFAQYT
jgi:hypothetical protein